MKILITGNKGFGKTTLARPLIDKITVEHKVIGEVISK